MILAPWIRSTFLMELRRIMAYRSEFWLEFIGVFFARVGLAYLIWKEIFSLNSSKMIGGYDFQSLIIYFIIGTFIFQIVTPQLGFIFRDIYEGSLSKYLLYPLSYFGYRFVILLGASVFYFLQIGLAIILAKLLLDPGTTANITLTSSAQGILATILALYLNYTIVAGFEYIAFWIENVWSLGVMMSITTMFLGGMAMPISAFADWAQPIVKALPFYFLVAFPVETFMGRINLVEYWTGIGTVVVWSVVCTFISLTIWKRGIRGYIGAGI